MQNNRLSNIRVDENNVDALLEGIASSTLPGQKDIPGEKPFSNNPDSYPVNGKYSADEDEEDVEEDLVLGDEEAEGDEEEFEVELEDDIDEDDIDEDDLVIDTDDDFEDDEDDEDADL